MAIPAALVLEYVSGRTLADLVEADGWLTPLRAARITEEIAAALDCAHAQGVIHRDVKPSNILLPRHGAARLSDFGVAHIDEDTPLTVMGDILGTIEYASPEQVHGNETPDARSDVYSLAAVAYFALTGTPPFRAADNSTQAQLSVMHRQVFAEPPSLRFHREGLSAEVEAAVLRGLAKAPASRYPSAGQFAAALRAAVEADAGVPEQRAMAAASRRTGALAGVLAAATLLLLGVLALWRTGQFAPSRPVQIAQVTKAASPLPTPPKAAIPVPIAVSPKSVTPAIPVIASAKPIVHPVPAPLPLSKPPVAVVKAPPAKPNVIKPTAQALVAAQSHPVKIPVKAAVRSALVPAALTASAFARSKPGPHPTAALIPHVYPRPLSQPEAPRLTVQAALPKSAAKTTPKAVARIVPKKAWLFVFAQQNLAPLGPRERMAGIKAQSVWVDGYRASDLAGGHWTSLPAGRHVISFVPDPKSGFAPHKNVVVMLSPGAHVRKQVLLPALIGSSPLLAALPPGSRQPSRSLSPTMAVVSTGRPVGWYNVSGWVAVHAPDHKSSLVRASAQWVKVDGQPLSALALGRWVQLPAGKHVITFQPTPALGIGPKAWNIDLKPQAHFNQQIPFPAPTPRVRLASPPVGQLSVSGWLPVNVPGQKPQLLPVSAAQVEIDGHPSPELAHGRWLSLPAGRHVLTFQPASGSGAASATRVISVAPQAHLNQLISPARRPPADDTGASAKPLTPRTI